MKLRGRRAFATAAPVVLLTLLLLTLSMPDVLAHARLIRSRPAAGSTLEQAPRLIELWFSAELEPRFNSIEVRDRRGERLDRAVVMLAEGGRKAQAELGDLGAGEYTVVWRVLSADGHAIRGTYTFTVAAAADGPPQPSDGREAARAPDQSMPVASSATWVESLVRWLGYLSMISLFGGFAFRLFVMGPAVRRAWADDDHAGEGDGVARVSTRHALRLMSVSAVALVLSSVVALAFQASAVSGRPLMAALSPSLLAGVVTGTKFGGAWLLQTLVALFLLILLLYLSGRADDGGAGPSWWLGLTAGAALLLAPSLTGHTAAAAREYGFATVSNWLHLLAAGLWVGGLFHLALALPTALRLVERPQERARLIARVISQFTRIAVPGVVVIALAGLYNAWVQVGSARALPGTTYGRALLLKVALVLVMLLLGGLNNFYLGRRAATESAVPQRSLARSVAVEACVGALVLLVTAALVFLTPAREHPVP